MSHRGMAHKINTRAASRGEIRKVSKFESVWNR